MGRYGSQNVNIESIAHRREPTRYAAASRQLARIGRVFLPPSVSARVNIVESSVLATRGKAKLPPCHAEP
jgi:hypothetical protein